MMYLNAPYMIIMIPIYALNVVEKIFHLKSKIIVFKLIRLMVVKFT